MSKEKRGRSPLVYTLWALATVIVVAAAVAGVIAARFGPEDLARIVAEQVQARTGRALAIEGDVRYSLSLVPRIAAEKVRLGNAPWGSRPDMLTASRIEVGIALLPLLAGRVRIEGLTLIEPDLLLEVDRTGKANWHLEREAAEPAGASESSASSPLRIGSVRIERGTLAYRDAARGRGLRLRLESLDVESEGDSAELEGKGTLDGAAIALSARLPLPGARDEAAEATLTGPGFRVHAKGTAALAPALDANVAFSADVTDWLALGKLLQAELPQLPALQAAGKLQVDDAGIAADGLDVRIGKSRLNGHARWVGNGGQRSLDLELDSPLLDLAELRSGKRSKAATDGSRLFSAEPFALAPLAAAAGKVELRIARLALRDGKSLQDVTVAATFDTGRIEVGAAQIHVDGRPLVLRAKADVTGGNVLGLDLAVEGRGIALGALGALLDLTGTPEGSPTDLDIRMRARGDSVRALMASANGDVRIVVGPGRIRNRVLDLGADVTELLKVINPAYAADQYTELRCAVARIPVRQGVARIANGIGVETSKVNLIAAGTIDLRNETLDIGIRTRPAGGLGLGLGTLAELARLRGTLADPKVEVDMGEAAKTAAHVGLAAITGGLSLVASGLLAERVPDNPCQVALTGKPAAAKPKPSQDAPAAVENVLEGIRKLFGR